MTPLPLSRLLVAALLFVSALPGFAAPANDAFTSATAFSATLASTRTGNAKEATYQSDEVVLDSSRWNGTIWFKWSPTTAGTGFAAPTFTWTADGNGDINGFDYEMVVYGGTSLSALTPVARGSEQSPIERFAFSTGQTYHFQVHVSTDPEVASFPYEMTLASATAPASAPTNDAWGSATVISGTAAVPITRNSTTAAATLESGESADSPQARTVWFKYTPSSTNVRQISLVDTSGLGSSPVLEVFTGSSVETLNRVARTDVDGESLVSLTAGTLYSL